jgi:hypothetical protein
MAYISNNAGATTGTLGTQSLGRVTLFMYLQPSGYTTLEAPVGTAGHNGHFNGAKDTSLNTHSGQYNSRFNDTGYYV